MRAKDCERPPRTDELGREVIAFFERRADEQNPGLYERYAVFRWHMLRQGAGRCRCRGPGGCEGWLAAHRLAGGAGSPRGAGRRPCDGRRIAMATARRGVSGSSPARVAADSRSMKSLRRQLPPSPAGGTRSFESAVLISGDFSSSSGCFRDGAGRILLRCRHIAAPFRLRPT